MKITILQPYLTPYRAGLFNEIADLEGIELSLVYFDRFEARRKWQCTYKVRFKEYYINSFIIKKTYEKNFRIPNLLHYFIILKKIKPDFIVCCPNIEGITSVLLKKKLNTKIIAWTEAITLTEKKRLKIKKIMRKFFFNKANYFLIPGEETLKYLQKIPCIKNDNYKFFPNTIDEFPIKIEDIINNKIKTLNKPKFIFSGSLNKRKGFELLLDAIKILNFDAHCPEYEFHILGTGYLKKEMKNVKYYGFLDNSKYFNIFSQCHFFILPSIYDYNPLTVLEALKLGCIPLLSDGVGNYPEYTSKYNNGFVFARNSKQEIFRILKKALSLDKYQCIKMMKKSYEIAKQVTHQNNADIFSKLIDSIK